MSAGPAGVAPAGFKGNLGMVMGDGYGVVPMNLTMEPQSSQVVLLRLVPFRKGVLTLREATWRLRAPPCDTDGSGGETKQPQQQQEGGGGGGGGGPGSFGGPRVQLGGAALPGTGMAAGGGMGIGGMGSGGVGGMGGGGGGGGGMMAAPPTIGGRHKFDILGPRLHDSNKHRARGTREAVTRHMMRVVGARPWLGVSVGIPAANVLQVRQLLMITTGSTLRPGVQINITFHIRCVARNIHTVI